VKVADIVITDDGEGTNTISLTGTDAASFEVVGTELFLAAGTALDYETQASYAVTVSVEDSSVAGSTPVTVDYTLAISNIYEIELNPSSVGENQSISTTVGALSIDGLPQNNELESNFELIYAGWSGTWHQARDRAIELGGHLATFSSEAEWNRMKSQVGGASGFWMGLTDEGQEGQWKWVTGEPLAYTNWRGCRRLYTRLFANGGIFRAVSI